VFARQALGIGFLFALARVGRGSSTRRRAPWTARDVALLLLISWGGFALPQVLLATGAARSTATAYALLTPLEPIGIVLGGAVLLSEGLPRVARDRARARHARRSLVVLQDGLHPDLGDAFGDLLMAGGHLAWAIYTLGAKSLLERHDEGRVSLGAVALTLPPLALLASTERSIPRARARAGLGVRAGGASTALVTWLWNWALHRTRAGTMGVLIFVQPVVGLTASQLASASAPGARAGRRAADPRRRRARGAARR
jgi:drug/metabolite transporter (DMT)-like permease